MHYILEIVRIFRSAAEKHRANFFAYNWAN